MSPREGFVRSLERGYAGVIVSKCIIIIIIIIVILVIIVIVNLTIVVTIIIVLIVLVSMRIVSINICTHGDGQAELRGGRDRKGARRNSERGRK